MTDDFSRSRHDGAADRTHKKLRRAIERPEKRYLWTPADMITFTPYLLPVFYGDGRALFAMSTLHQRPRYWVIRGCSSWGSGMDRETAPGPDFAELTDDLLTDLEDAFGRGRCGFSGQTLFWPRKERLQNCQCEECDEKRWKARWPMVDDRDGTQWSRCSWPDGFKTVKNPLSYCGTLLDPSLSQTPLYTDAPASAPAAAGGNATEQGRPA